jgi:hypothetical protein
MPTNNDTCLVCGRPKSALHHLAGRSNLSGLETGLCERHHGHLDGLLRAAGVPLRHDRQPTEAEVSYALISGLASLFAELTVAIGERGSERAATIERVAFGARRLILLILPTSERSFGPSPIKHAGTRRRPRASLPAACPADPTSQLERLLALTSEGAQATLASDRRHCEYLSTLDAVARRIASATRHMVDQRPETLAALLAALTPSLADLAEVAEITATIDPHDPDPAQLDRINVTLAGLVQLERRLFGLVLDLAAAEDETMAEAAIVRFLTGD